MDWWWNLPASAQDGLFVALLVLPGVLLLVATTLGFRPLPLVLALLRAHAVTHVVFVCLLATSIGLGLALSLGERALREGSARAADPFDLVVGPPGSDTALTLAAVYLQAPGTVLLDPDIAVELLEDPAVSDAAPLAFGDSVDGAPLVGSTAGFAATLGGIATGRHFASRHEAIVGARSPLGIGDRFHPAHGLGRGLTDSLHEHVEFEVVGRLKASGTPWDHAVMVPIEAIWISHGLGSGHADGVTRIGPPYDATRMPGVSAVVVKARTLMDNYRLRDAFSSERSMAVFPGEVLSRLHGVLGNVSEAMSLLTALTQLLVLLGVGTALVVLMRLFAPRIAMLRAIGASSRFVVALTLNYVALLAGVGALLGTFVGLGLSRVLAGQVAERVAFDIAPSMALIDVAPVAAFFSMSVLLAAVPATVMLVRPVAEELA